MSAVPLIELVEVSRTFERGDVPVRALRGVSLTIQRGEFVAIMGASGSGKSTLMNILGCLDRPNSGRYSFDGTDVAGLPPDEVARLRRSAFGFVFQSYNLIATASALENVEIPAIYAGLPQADRRDRAEALLRELGLGDRLDHRPGQLSGGQQQRVAIARALMNGGQVIFADEPTGALDSASGAEVLALLRRLNQMGHTVVLITHDRDVAEHADRLVEMKDGLVVADRRLRPARIGGAGRFGAPEHRGSALFGETGEALRMALRSLRANLFRTVLTLLGIVIGVGSVITMMAVGEGAKQSVLERISAMGTHLLLVRPSSSNLRGAGGPIATLVPEDALAMAELPNVAVALPELTGSATLRFGSVDYQTQVNATTAEFPMVRDWALAAGDFITEADVVRHAPVTVLGRTVADALFPGGENPVGRHVLMNNALFQVIGVLAPKGATAWGTDMDDVAVVPLTTGALRLFGQRHLRSITVLVEDLDRIDETQAAVTRLLIERHRAEDFRIRNMASILETATETQNTLTLLLGSIAAISLLVGGIGVMNIMLVSVSERTREIGIRVATGARTANIVQQFVTEAVAVSTIGGIVGVVSGLGLAMALKAAGTPIVLSAGIVALAFGCAFVTGLVFGYAPARKAAALDPVVALSSD